MNVWAPLGACSIGCWLPESIWLLVVCRLRSRAGCMRVVGYWRQAAMFQCTGSRGRLSGPSCGRASRMYVCGYVVMFVYGNLVVVCGCLLLVVIVWALGVLMTVC